ncbi:MAG TPA: hypothetical protein VM100_04455, partial [Longimicrobiales bacterium]|nr:hypothetical protein [Longimicrobiales bacterium]
MHRRLFLIAPLLLTIAHAAHAQRISKSAYYGWASDRPFIVKFDAKAPGEVIITVSWTGSEEVLGQKVPLQWGASLGREGAVTISSKGMPVDQLLAWTTGNRTGKVTLKYTITSADLTSGSAWIARATSNGPVTNDIRLSVTVSYPVPAADALYDVALVTIDPVLTGAGRNAIIGATLKNAGQKDITASLGTVNCKLKQYEFSGSRDLGASAAWKPGTTRHATMRLSRDTAFIDPGKNITAGTHAIRCNVVNYAIGEQQEDYFQNNDTLNAQITVPVPPASSLGFAIDVDDCKGGLTFFAGGRACAILNWTNNGGGFDGGFTTTCRQGGQQMVVNKAGWTRYGDVGRQVVDLGSLSAGQHIIICAMTGTALRATAERRDTINVRAPARMDAAVIALSRVVESSQTGSRLDVWIRNNGTVALTKMTLTCKIGNQDFTNPYVYAPPGDSLKMRALSPLPLTSLPEGITNAQCTAATDPNSDYADADLSNNTLSAQVRITHPGHEPYIDIRKISVALESSFDTHYPQERAAKFDDRTLRIDVDTVMGTAPRAAAYFICVKDAAGKDLSSQVEADKVLVGSVSLNNAGYYFPDPFVRITWTDVTSPPPSTGIIHVEAWDSTRAPTADAACAATTDPLAGPNAPSKNGLWAMMEVKSALPWRVSDTFAKNSAIDKLGGRTLSGPTRNAPKDTTPTPPPPLL